MDYEIHIDDTTSSLLDAIAKAEDDPVLLAALAEVDAEEFRQFMAECGEDSREAVQLLKAAELQERSRTRGKRLHHYRKTRQNQLPTNLTYLLIGGGIGAIIALLFAPKSGHELREDIADATRQGIDRSREAAQQLRERAAEYYETSRERAAELYSTASERVGDTARTARETASDLARTARETAARQTGTVAAAIDAGKKAYQEEKRKTEMSGRIEAAPKYDEKAN